jgi:5'-nucleotidase (lipoprotein e(P4) family)
MPTPRFLLLACAAVTLVSCHPSGRPPATQPAASAATRPPAATHTPRRTHENLNAVLWTQTAAEYTGAARQAYRLARTQLDAGRADPKWTAAIEQTDDPSSLPLAVVMDLDETVLDNSAFQARLVADSSPDNAVPFTEEPWNRWCEERKATAIAGSIEFLKYAQSRGVTPIYITNRDHVVEAATRDVLKKLGVPLDETRDTVLTRHENGWDASDKSARRQFVAQSYRILLLVGDNFEDFAPGTRASIEDRAALTQKYADYWGTRWIVLPNPMYGSWEQAVTFGQGQLTDDQTLAAKYRTLRTER